MGRGVRRSDHSLRCGNRRDRGAATGLATSGTASRRRPHTGCEHRTFTGPIGEGVGERGAGSDRRAVVIRSANGDRGSFCQSATICGAATIRNARTDRGAIEDAGTDLRSRRGGRDLGHICRGGTGQRQRIEDGEPLDSRLGVDV